MFVLKSSAFADGGKIPEKYTEKNLVSPPLGWGVCRPGPRAWP